MKLKDKRVDEYVEKSAEFARPILSQIRALVHSSCPEVEETIKWGMPFFMHRGVLCMMAAFKAHCMFRFWKHAMVFSGPGKADAKTFARCHRFTSPADLPADALFSSYVRKAAQLNESGAAAPAKRSPKKKAPKAPLTIPAYFAEALRKNKKAQTVFENFSYSHKKEYLEWITQAKQEETRQRRMTAALVMMTEGKSRNWKYASK